MTIYLWLAFVALVCVFLALDLGVFNRKAHVIHTREALIWTAVWVVAALLFNVLLYFIYENDWMGMADLPSHEKTGKAAALAYLTGYVVEKSLSLDNIFVIAVIFNFFSVPRQYEHRVLFWGILGALVMRGAMIAGGSALVERFDWITYVFGVLLLFTAVKMALAGDEQVHPDRNPLVRIARTLYPVSTEYEGQKFFTRIQGKRGITPLFLVLLVVESTDVLFAVDSIPAIFAITRDPFIVFTSNVFAILGLRSLFFALSGMMAKFRHIKHALVFVLAFIGVKMLIEHYYHIPIPVTLAVIAGAIGVGVAASLVASRNEPAA